MTQSKKKKHVNLSAKRSRKALKRKAEKARGQGRQSGPHETDFSKYPIHQTLIMERIFDIGQGIAVFSRMLPGGGIALSYFLVDVYCQGIKNADHVIIGEGDYKDFLRRSEEFGRFTDITPECLVKLLRDSVEYAEHLGFSPHRDYRKAVRNFGAVTGDECDRTFEFGKDGKPLYVAGPDDSPVKIAGIMSRLEKIVGSDGFHYIYPLDMDGDDQEDEKLFEM